MVKARFFCFLHANGYPSGTYKKFLAALRSSFRIIAMEQRPIWDPGPPGESLTHWRSLAEDYISFLEASELTGIVGAGHSLGAVVTLFAAHMRPDLFDAVVFVEPVFLKTRYMILSALTPQSWKQRVPMVQKALNRPDQWETREDAFEFHRGKRAFEGLSDEVLWDYVDNGMTHLPESGVRLTFSKEWEAHIYCTGP